MQSSVEYRIRWIVPSYLDVLDKDLEYKVVPVVEEELLFTDSQEDCH